MQRMRPRLQVKYLLFPVKAVTTHIGHSILCQKEGKGVQTVTMIDKQSGWAKDQENGAVGGAGTWPVRHSAAPVTTYGMRCSMVTAN